MLLAPKTRKCGRCDGLLRLEVGIQEGDRLVCMICSRASFTEITRPIRRNTETESVTVTYGGTQTQKGYLINIFYQIVKINGEPFIKVSSVRPMHKYQRATAQGKNLKVRRQHFSRIRNQIFRKRGIKVLTDDEFFPVG